MTVVVAIPTIGLSPYLSRLVADCWDQGAKAVRLYDNRSEIENAPWALNGSTRAPEICWCPGESIYAEWNYAAFWAADLGARLLILNDDIAIPDGMIEALSAALDHHSDFSLVSVDGPIGHAICDPTVVEAVSHTDRRYEFAAWCFMARPERWQPIDVRYRVFYGDDDLLWKMNHAGRKTGVLRGVGVHHDVSFTSRQLPWVQDAIVQDQALWQSMSR